MKGDREEGERASVAREKWVVRCGARQAVIEIDSSRERNSI